ncbi:MAG TPA: hypothetical protein VHS32_00460 [Streptosporangiaceae bacterium]|nr:hypothetical protein [Streptosporangiaceae bacterium]
MPEIAVLAGTAHSALAAGICAGRGVRCAASQAGSAAAWPCCPVAASDSANPSTMSPRINSARAAKTRTTSRPPGAVVHLVQGPEPGAAAAQPGHGSPPCSGTSHS